MRKQILISFLLLLSLLQVCSLLAAGKCMPFGNPANKLQSKGVLAFKHNGQLFTADAAYARGYAVAATQTGYLTAANSSNMVLNIEKAGMIKPGLYKLVPTQKSKCSITVNSTTYFLKEESDYLLINITVVREEGNMILLTGSFEGKLHDKKGNSAVITEGNFTTHNL